MSQTKNWIDILRYGYTKDNKERVWRVWRGSCANVGTGYIGISGFKIFAEFKLGRSHLLKT